jgi:hypothetical protein
MSDDPAMPVERDGYERVWDDALGYVLVKKRETQVGNYIDTVRATCTECMWSDVGKPYPQARAHVQAFGHDVTVSTIVVQVVTLKPAPERKVGE